MRRLVRWSQPLIFLVLATSAACASDSRFHFNDCVTVVSGFYKGCQGRVIDQHSFSAFEVFLTTCGSAGKNIYQTIDADHLKLEPPSLCKR